MWTGPKTLRSQ